MKEIKFERIAGEGAEAIYFLYVDGSRRGDVFTMGELLEEIAALYEPQKPAPLPPVKSCNHEWMGIADKEDSILYQCIHCKKLKTVRFGDPETIDPAYMLPTERRVEL